MPVLEKTLRFAGARQRILVHNIANIDTPNFQPRDLSVTDFRSELRRVVENRRASGEMEAQRMATRDVREHADGRFEVDPKSPSGNVLYHDRNDRDLERMMQGLAENGLQYRLTVDLIRQQHDQLRVAITQRV